MRALLLILVPALTFTLFSRVAYAASEYLTEQELRDQPSLTTLASDAAEQLRAISAEDCSKVRSVCVYEVSFLFDLVPFIYQGELKNEQKITARARLFYRRATPEQPQALTVRIAFIQFIPFGVPRAGRFTYEITDEGSDGSINASHVVVEPVLGGARKEEKRASRDERSIVSDALSQVSANNGQKGPVSHEEALNMYRSAIVIFNRLVLRGVIKTPNALPNVSREPRSL